jgi:hypothetical protein
MMEEATGGGNQTAYGKENTPSIRARRVRAQQSSWLVHRAHAKSSTKSIPDIGPSRRADAVPQCSALIVGRDKAVHLSDLQVDYPILLNPGRHVERKFFAQIEY